VQSAGQGAVAMTVSQDLEACRHRLTIARQGAPMGWLPAGIDTLTTARQAAPFGLWVQALACCIAVQLHSVASLSQGSGTPLRKVTCSMGLCG